MHTIKLQKSLTYFIAAVWLVNGLFCKVLNMVPRHQQIVESILGEEFAGPLTIIIGIAEVGMAVWILSGIQPRLNAIAQISVVALMNIIEFVVVPELLLWGRFNAVFALLFIWVVYYKEFGFQRQVPQKV
ncbi:DoxX-like family protein [Nafulsella turpanensis]|uniref:DoxX-like family protein n=1 Tax=Nafulsella turpanensis TaxID=1265690 RepID=UPI00036B3081|nr:DoxX-like family protein [Nafulsella turpanensis]